MTVEARPPSWSTTLDPARDVAQSVIARRLEGSRRVVILDDDPTGTQTVRDVPVLTRWRVEDIRWALSQDAIGFFILINTRSLGRTDAAARNREAASACLRAAEELGVDIVFCSRSDSTLRGHFPLETDVLTDVVTQAGSSVDGIVLCPAYLDAGRVTVDGIHWIHSASGLTPVAQSEFARDATYGYRSSRLADWVEEKSAGRIPASTVTTLDITALRTLSVAELAARLTQLREGAVVAVDAVTDEDLRIATLAILEAEGTGARLLYRVGPSFVRARLGQVQNTPVEDAVLRRIVDRGRHGLVVVGSHVGLTTRQLDELRSRRSSLELEVDVALVLDEERTRAHLADVVDRALSALEHELVVLRTSRDLVRGADPEDSLHIARRVSAAITAVTREVVQRGRPAYVVAKGGITSSDLATHALALEHAWVRGSMLPGIVSLWEPADNTDLPPFIVFAGNVGDDQALSDVVDRLEGIEGREGLAGH